MKAKANVIALFCREFGVFFQPLFHTVTFDSAGKMVADLDAIKAYFRSVGYDLEPIVKDPDFWKKIESIDTAVMAIAEKLKHIGPLVSETIKSINFPDDIKDIPIVIKELPKDTKGLTDFYDELKPQIDDLSKGFKSLTEYCKNLIAISGNTDLTDALKRLPQATLNALTYRYLGGKHPAMMPTLEFLTLATWGERKEHKHGDKVVVVENLAPSFHPSVIKSLCTAPGTWWQSTYWPGPSDVGTSPGPAGFGTSVDSVNIVAKKLFTHIQAVLEGFGAHTTLGLPPAEMGLVYPANITPAMQKRMEGVLTWNMPVYSADQDKLIYFGASVGLLVPGGTDQGPGIFILPFGNFAFSIKLPPWALSLQGSFPTTGLKVNKSGVTWLDTSVNALNLSIAPQTGEEDLYALGSASRLEIGRPTLKAELKPGNNGTDFDTSLFFAKNKIVFAKSGEDDFLGNILPESLNGAEIPFGLGVGWSNQKGFYLFGSAALDIKLVLNLTLFHAIHFDWIKLSLQAAQLKLSVSAYMEFPRSVFQPLLNGAIDPDETKKSRISVEVGAILTSSKTGFKITETYSSSFTESAILNTGFTLALTGMKLDLSRTKNIPEAVADGRPADFIGVYMKAGTIGFPLDWGHDKKGTSTGELFVSNLLAGTGGISGTIGLRAKNGTGSKSFISVCFGDSFTASLDAFSMTFHQNAILKSEITGHLDLPGFQDSIGDPAKIEIKIGFEQNGDFEISAKEEDGINLPLHLEKFLTVAVKSLKVGKRSKKVYVAVGGKISFADQGSGSFLGNFLPKDIDIDKLLIWENGQIELEGGVVTLAQPIKLNLGPVKLTVTALGMGSHERMHGGQLRKYKYVEFSAGISINPGGVDARGDGIKVYFTIDNKKSEGRDLDVYVRIQSIAIDLIIPGSASKDQATLLLSGYLSMKEPKDGNSDAGTEYAGGIDFKLPKMKMGGSADMRYNPKVPSFLIDVSLEISTPIVLGATGMGIYGFRALFGKRYVVSKTEIGLTEESEWWQYYKKKVPPKPKEGITAFKMANKAGFSFGAGVSLATAADGGQAFSSKLFFLLSLPDVFLLQGQAQILKGRIGLDTDNDPPFFALIAIDKTSISAALGVNYKIPETGKIVAVDALIEMAYFWRDSSAWYLNIGRDQPVDRRVRARIFDLFDVYSYFMLNAKGIRTGAGASLEKLYNYGPVKARLYAYMDTAGRLSFKPLQIGGSIQIGGGVDIKVCGMGLSATASASLAAEAPKPFIITGAADACVKVLRKQYCVHFDFTWTFEKSLDWSEIPIIGTELNKAVKALNMMSQEALDVLCFPKGDLSKITPADFGRPEENVIPMDSYIDIEFKRPVKPFKPAVAGAPPSSLLRFGGTNPGADYTEYVAPQRGKSDRVRHEYILNDVEIFIWDTKKWVPYNVFEALAASLQQAPINLTQEEMDDLTKKGQYGFWQIDNPGKYTKLRLMAQNPLSFLRQGTGDTIPEDLGVTNGIFCAPPERKKTCVNFDSLGLFPGQKMEATGNKILQQQRVMLRIVRGPGSLIHKPYNQVKSALSYDGSDTLELYLPEPMVEINLLVGTVTSGLTIKYYARTQTGISSSNTPVFDYNLIKTVSKTRAQLVGGVQYSDPKAPVDKIEITGQVPNVTLLSAVFCDADISGEAQAFLQLLNLVAVREALTPETPKLTGEVDLMQEPYKSIVTTLPIFSRFRPEFIASMDKLLYSPEIKSVDPRDPPTKDLNNVLTITFFKDRVGPTGEPLSCVITFTIPPTAGLKWDERGNYKFRNMRPDPAHPGVVGGNSYFLIDVVWPSGTVLAVQGVSTCFPIFTCYDQYLNFFHQICYLNMVDFQYNQNLPTAATVNGNNQTMADAINKILWPVWRPDTAFAIRVDYTDNLYREASQNPETFYNNSFVIGFKTQGPIGHYHEFPVDSTTEPSKKLKAYSDLEGVDREDTFKLSTLKYYIDFPKSYPDPSGNILNAKPLYYESPELRLFYLYPHVYQFYQNWAKYKGAAKVDSSLEVLIKDPAEVPLVVKENGTLGPSEAPPPNNKWETNSFPIITPDIAALNNMIKNGAANPDLCLPSPAPFTPKGINNLVTPSPKAPLEPLKLYTAIYQAAYKPDSLTNLTVAVRREVYRHAFQTSRYKDFKEHINSYILKRDTTTKAIEKAAVYVLKKAFAAKDIARAKDVLAGTLPSNDLLHTEAALQFDKLIDRIFGFQALEPAEYLQFNIILDTTSATATSPGTILGIWLRSPEPFNDPRMPAIDLYDPNMPAMEFTNTVQMGVEESGKVYWDRYVTYFSKDNSSAFITNRNGTMNVPPSSKCTIQFRYKLYDGNNYKIKDSEKVVLELGPYLKSI